MLISLPRPVGAGRKIAGKAKMRGHHAYIFAPAARSRAENSRKSKDERGSCSYLCPGRQQGAVPTLGGVRSCPFSIVL